MKNSLKNFSIILFITVLAITISVSCSNSGNSKESGRTESGIFSPQGGFYNSAQKVIITTDQGSTVYYTLDGSVPTESSTEYIGPIELSEEAVVRVLVVSGNERKRSMMAYDFDLNSDAYHYTRKASPNWQDQIIYMCMIDRFSNGDTLNDYQFAGEPNDKSNEEAYSGGDLSGLESKLTHLRNLGVTVICINPPVKHLWKNQDGNGGYHGYWASDFTKVDPHYGTMEEYRSFVQAAHDEGMYVIQDIVLNHTGDYFSISDAYDGTNWSLNSDLIPTSRPEQLPWSLNDPTELTDDEVINSFYHWTPTIIDFNDESQRFTYQMSGLDDINTDNSDIANLLRGYYRYWIDQVDIDGYRVDSFKFIDPAFFEDFCNSTESDNMGIRTHAESLGKNNFILFGKGFYDDERSGASYTQSDSGTARMDSLMYYPLNTAIRNVFGKGESTSKIADVLNKRYTTGYANPDKLVTFIDNQDLERMLDGTSSECFKSAYALIMSIPGIPQIYYGVEQGLLDNRSSMFKGGFKNDGVVNTRDYYDESGEYWYFFKDLIDLRKNNSVFRYGTATVFSSESSGTGNIAIKIVNGSGGVENTALYIANTSSSEVVLENVESGLDAGSVFTLKTPSVGSMPSSITLAADGKLTATISAKSYGIYIMTGYNE